MADSTVVKLQTSEVNYLPSDGESGGEAKGYHYL